MPRDDTLYSGHALAIGLLTILHITEVPCFQVSNPLKRRILANPDGISIPGNLPLEEGRLHYEEKCRTVWVLMSKYCHGRFFQLAQPEHSDMFPREVEQIKNERVVKQTIGQFMTAYKCGPTES